VSPFCVISKRLWATVRATVEILVSLSHSPGVQAFIGSGVVLSRKDDPSVRVLGTQAYPAYTNSQSVCGRWREEYFFRTRQGVQLRTKSLRLSRRISLKEGRCRCQGSRWVRAAYCYIRTLGVRFITVLVVCRGRSLVESLLRLTGSTGFCQSDISVGSWSGLKRQQRPFPQDNRIMFHRRKLRNTGISETCLAYSGRPARRNN
jgi:hypothetical protein